MTIKRKRSADSPIEDNEFTDAVEEATGGALDAKSEREEKPTENEVGGAVKPSPKRKIRVLNLNRPQSNSPVRNTPKFSPLK